MVAWNRRRSCCWAFCWAVFPLRSLPSLPPDPARPCRRQSAVWRHSTALTQLGGVPGGRGGFDGGLEPAADRTCCWAVAFPPPPPALAAARPRQTDSRQFGGAGGVPGGLGGGFDGGLEPAPDLLLGRRFSPSAPCWSRRRQASADRQSAVWRSWRCSRGPWGGFDGGLEPAPELLPGPSVGLSFPSAPALAVARPRQTLPATVGSLEALPSPSPS